MKLPFLLTEWSHRSHRSTLGLYFASCLYSRCHSRERCRVVLEEVFPGQMISSIFFPVSKRGSKGNIRRAVKKDMGASMRGPRSAGLAVCGEVWMKSFAVFARGGMISGGAGHAAHGFDIVAGHVKEEAATSFVDNIRFEEPTLTSYGHPSASFVRLGVCENAPVARHIPFELVNKVRAEDADRNGRTHGGTAFGEAIGSLVAVNAFVGRAVCEGHGGGGSGQEIVKKDVYADRG